MTLLQECGHSVGDTSSGIRHAVAVKTIDTTLAEKQSMALERAFWRAESLHRFNKTHQNGSCPFLCGTSFPLLAARAFFASCSWHPSSLCSVAEVILFPAMLFLAVAWKKHKKPIPKQDTTAAGKLTPHRGSFSYL